MQPCAVCGEAFPEADLLFGDRGRTCAGCIVQSDEAADEARRLWLLVAGPPLVAVGALLVVCVPVIGTLLGLLMGCVALLGGLNAIQVAWRLDPDAGGVPDQIQTFLYVSGAFSVLLSLATVALLLLMLTMFVVFQVL